MMNGSRRSKNSLASLGGSRATVSLKGSGRPEQFEDHDEEEEEYSDDESGSVYSDEQEEDEESSYESELNSSKESTHQTFNIAKKESNRVRVWRTVLSLMLVATAAVVIVTTYIFLTDNEENEFESAFSQAAATISDSMRFNHVKMIDSMNSRAEAITSLALSAGLRWPYVTVPHFEIRGGRARKDGLSETFGFSPFVAAEDKQEWEEYSIQNQGWVLEGRGIDVDDPAQASFLPTTPIIPTEITYVNENSNLSPYGPVDENTPDTPFAVNWQMSPVPALTYTVNLNLRSSDLYRHLIQMIMDTKVNVMSDFTDLGRSYDTVIPPEEHQQMHDEIVGTDEGKFFKAQDRPHSVMLTPIFDTFKVASREVVGMVWSVVPWDWQLADLLPSSTKLIHVVLDNSCGTAYTYELEGPKAILLGPGDLHDTTFESMGVTSEFMEEPATLAYNASVQGGTTEIINNHTYTLCKYVARIYPTKEMRASYDTGRPETFAIVMAGIFLITGMVFLIFIRYVQQRQDMVMATAIRTSAIVSSLFPANVRERIMKDAEEQGRMDLRGGKSRGGNWRLPGGEQGVGPKSKLEDFVGLEAGGGGAAMGAAPGGALGGELDAFKSKPIADLFPDATVLFADLVGFTAWSSEREPTQVFQLLETLYHAFDTIARKRRVFKVETIGDCYVAVTGLPEPRKDHAVAMARFAKDCMQKMKVLVVKLEVPLGPGTADLSMRFGLHSGPVTAGVLRGEKSRFQLFGDTVNTAARMESNGAKERIHVSQETADLIEAANKPHWLTPREDKIHAKGKGELQTYWLEIKRDNNMSGNMSLESESESDYSDFTEEDSMEEDIDGEIVLDERSQRLVDWTVDQLSRLLKQIAARRQLLGLVSDPEISEKQVLDFSDGGTVIDEVEDVVELLPFDPKATNLDALVDNITLSAEVVSQLRDFVATIATLHNDNQFHNLSHATHVTMSVVKLLSRIVAVDDPRLVYAEGSDESEMSQEATDQRLHDFSYGLRSDPLAQFGVVFSALIHDVDHPGVTNAELIKEDAKVAQTYNGKCISEQNSVDLAWYLFMDERYSELRGAIYHDETDLRRFRQLIVNAVIATDIADKELKVQRDQKWENAFREGPTESAQLILNRKATVMIDCLLQSSDIAHTMQHWHIYRKWNEFLFRELYVAFLAGRCEKNPADFWYDGEIGFFDFYIIPLAKKLADCGVFGVSSDEYLNYARKNRNEWKARGKGIVEEYIENAKDLQAPESGDEDEDSTLTEQFQDEDGVDA